VNRKQACLNQAELCRERAAADPKGRDYWSKEADRWQKAADDCGSRSAVTHEVRDGRMIPKRASNQDPLDSPEVGRLLNGELRPLDQKSKFGAASVH
jgi:hypothetical protein